MQCALLVVSAVPFTTASGPVAPCLYSMCKFGVNIDRMIKHDLTDAYSRSQ